MSVYYWLLDKLFAVFDKVLGLVIEFMAHTNNLANLELLILFMSICIQNKEIDKLSSFATGIILTKDESAVKLMLNSAAEMVFQYMDPEDVDEVVKDINSRCYSSKYLIVKIKRIPHRSSTPMGIFLLIINLINNI